MSDVYDEAAVERRVPEPDKRPGRTAFQRDRARVLHSGAFRRLAGKTQVVEPVGSNPLVPRTRLTHSLECAQIGRELGASLGCDPDLVDVACLAHDLGHPPYGHNGETALDEAAQQAGGFEGNAQSFRLLTRLEPKVDGAGLNLTRAALDAATKYPWTRDDRRKFGVYDDDVATFAWVRQGQSDERRPLETQVMDFADDVAYSVHDLEDGVVAGLIDLAALPEHEVRDHVVARARAHYLGAGEFELEEVYGGLVNDLWQAHVSSDGTTWVPTFEGTLRDLAALKDVTSALIGRFCAAAEQATRARYGGRPLSRYDADLVVPTQTKVEIAVLKAMAAVLVMDLPAALARQEREREVVRELVVQLTGRPEAMEPAYRVLHAEAADDAARLRVVVDQVAALTDAAALGLHARLTGVGGTT
ncbi:MAG TPA: deoxyguanosinetriphosphate triphosphohydrolase [Mycobacteriales bacterium]|nr:deoxyguanosinetriphosphate triphosphohydrolase [Mycobacteriales bacterium]